MIPVRFLGGGRVIFGVMGCVSSGFGVCLRGRMPFGCAEQYNKENKIHTKENTENTAKGK